MTNFVIICIKYRSGHTFTDFTQNQNVCGINGKIDLRNVIEKLTSHANGHILSNESLIY